MSERIIATTRIVYKREYREYIVRAFDQHGVHWPNADYFTSDKEDAQSTALAMIAQFRKLSSSRN